MSFCVFVFSCSSDNESQKKDSALLRVLIGEKYGYINEDGKIVIEPQFDEAYIRFTEGLCYAQMGDRRGFIDESGLFSIELPDSVSSCYNFVNGLSRVAFYGWHKENVVDKSGHFILKDNQYSVSIVEDDDSSYILVEGRNDEKDWFITDTKGNTIGSPCDSILHGFRNGLCPIKLDGKWGYMDNTGVIIIKPAFDVAKTFGKDKVARVRQGEEEFYIDFTGNKLFSVDKTLTGFNCNRAFAVVNGEKRLIDRQGNKICAIDADRVGSFDSKTYLATIIKDGKASKIDTTGNIVLSSDYDVILSFIDGIAPVTKDKKVGYIDLNGKEIISVTNESYLTAFNQEGSNVRAVQNKVNGTWEIKYYDLHGRLIGKDMPVTKVELAYKPTRDDFVEYFDSRLGELDPIEGIYYVTIKDYYQSRENPNSIGMNDTESAFYAIAKDDRIDGYRAYLADGSNKNWVNKFVKIGETNSYAILKIDKENDYSSEGKMTLEDPGQFEFRLETGHNNWYNFFATYEFVRDYPPIAEFEKVQKAEWTGTGFAIADGYIATNYHVTSGAKTIRIKGINGELEKSYKGIAVASDKEHDLSIIKIVDKDFDSMGSLPYKIGRTSVDVGDNIFVLGYPMTSSMGKEIKLTDGIISSSTGFRGDDAMYQISAAVQPGNSGGPVFNENGVIIGVVCGKHLDAENANYAIKISYLFSLISSSDLGIDISGKEIKEKKLSKQVKKVKDFVYLIECRSK